ncbi:MAG: aldehyde dehydrogenase family protein [Bacteroidia bacterium]|nr:aldehyde dehydrogenase family protein [Bacteroidia bacterium]
MKKLYIPYVAGEFVASGKRLAVRSPYSGEAVFETFSCDHLTLEKALASAFAARGEMQMLPSWKKEEILLHLASRIGELEEFFTQVIILESGKPYRYAKAEVERAIQTFKVAAEECKRLPKDYFSLDWTKAGEGREGLVKYFPSGVVAGISPFNFPLNLAVHKIAPAIAAGCPIILKPASATPISTLALAELVSETALPKGGFHVLPMDRNTGVQLVEDPRVAVLSFTGSPDVGWNLKSRAGKKKVVLELGGNAGVIVSATADVDLAVKRSLTGAFGYSGQVCIHAQRFFIHESCWEKFTGDLMASTLLLKEGNPMSPETAVSHLIDSEAAERVEQWIREAEQEGAKILCGGQRQGNFVEPTILTNVNPEMKVCREEVFGPVITMEKFSSFPDAVERLNKGRFGLQAGVFTQLVHELDMAFHQLEVGGVIHNDVPTFRMDHMPYGGVKDSGLGREGVPYAIREFMEARILVK